MFITVLEYNSYTVKHSLIDQLKAGNLCTVESRYLELGYLEFCEVRSVSLNQKYILIAFSSNSLTLETFYKFKLPEVQINLQFG